MADRSLNSRNCFFSLAIVIFFPFFLRAQFSVGIKNNFHYGNSFSFTDSLPHDSLLKQKIHSPKKAVIYSACLPGLGQVYNKKYWKVPIIYAGFAGLGYGFWWNEREWTKYHHALLYRYDNDPNTIDPYPSYSDDDLVTLKNYYERYRNLCVIGATALYTLNLIDAAVDAHLMSFNVNDDLSMNISPAIFPSGNSSTFGIYAALHFR
ncbi:MAG: hypothetical protein HY064_11905 [Bacteroidetes bacterium]|nr:hypothetical protein [Bacteroidota bacterium]